VITIASRIIHGDNQLFLDNSDNRPCNIWLCFRYMW